MRRHDKDCVGFTLIEIVMIIVVLGLLAALIFPSFVGVSENSRITATQYELQTLKRAIVGNPSAVVGGRYIDVGFEGDIGHPPASLVELGIKPDSIPAYDTFTRLGWNGPYIDTAGDEYLTDAWGDTYVYDMANRRIMSTGGADTIAVRF
jgi:general secretion pathway protein G